MTKRKLRNRLARYREIMKELAVKDAMREGVKCFDFDTKPFDEVIALLDDLIREEAGKCQYCGKILSESELNHGEPTCTECMKIKYSARLMEATFPNLFAGRRNE